MSYSKIIQTTDIALNSAILIPISNKDNPKFYEISCKGIAKNNEFLLLQEYVKPEKENYKNLLIYFPNVLYPTYKGRLFEIKWNYGIHSDKSETFDVKLRSLLPFSTKNFFDKNLELLVDNVNLLLNYDNIVTLKSPHIRELNEVSLLVEECVNKKIADSNTNEIILNKKLYFDLENDQIKIKIRLNEDYPTVHNSIFSLRHRLVLKFKDRIAEVPLYFFQKRLDVQNLPRTSLKYFIIKYLNDYGPMKVGELISTIFKQEKIRIKSTQMRSECEELINQGVIVYRGLGIHASKLFLRSG